MTIVKNRIFLGVMTFPLVLAIILFGGYLLNGIISSKAEVSLLFRWGTFLVVLLVVITLCSFYIRRFFQERDVVVVINGERLSINDRAIPLQEVERVERTLIWGDNATRSFRVSLRSRDGDRIVLVYYADGQSSQDLAQELSRMLQLPIHQKETAWGW